MLSASSPAWCVFLTPFKFVLQPPCGIDQHLPFSPPIQNNNNNSVTFTRLTLHGVLLGDEMMGCLSCCLARTWPPALCCFFFLAVYDLRRQCVWSWENAEGTSVGHRRQRQAASSKQQANALNAGRPLCLLCWRGAEQKRLGEKGCCCLGGLFCVAESRRKRGSFSLAQEERAPHIACHATLNARAL